MRRHRCAVAVGEIRGKNFAELAGVNPDAADAWRELRISLRSCKPHLRRPLRTNSTLHRAHLRNGEKSGDALKRLGLFILNRPHFLPRLGEREAVTITSASRWR